MRTLDAYNASAPGKGFDPAIKDGCATSRAQTGQEQLGNAPCGTSRFTPLKSPAASPSPTADWRWTWTAGCLMSAASPLRGLFAAGELVGGLFFDGYPGGSGLTAGAVLWDAGAGPTPLRYIRRFA